MFRSRTLLAAALAAAMGSAVMAAKPAGSADSNKPAPRRSQARLTKPYSELKDLTDAEKTRIVEIHQKAVDQVHEIEAKEKADILAVLSPQQKKELVEIEAKDREAARERRGRATTQPSRQAGSSARE